jgi:hypothetical protein
MEVSLEGAEVRSSILRKLPSYRPVNADARASSVFWIGPDPDILAQEIVDDLEAALESFRAIANVIQSCTIEGTTAKLPITQPILSLPWNFLLDGKKRVAHNWCRG